MDYDPRSEPHNLARDPVTSLVVPRPIGWITTITATGLVNLAPYSFFNLVAGTKNPFVMFSSSGRKHTQHNAETAGEFVFNLATFELRTEMNQTGATLDETISEPEVAGLAMVPSRVVKPPRVALSPIALECKYVQTVPLVGTNGQQDRERDRHRRGRQHPHRRQRDRRRHARYPPHAPDRAARLHGLLRGGRLFHDDAGLALPGQALCAHPAIARP